MKDFEKLADVLAAEYGRAQDVSRSERRRFCRLYLTETLEEGEIFAFHPPGAERFWDQWERLEDQEAIYALSSLIYTYVPFAEEFNKAVDRLATRRIAL